jgi:hypothetical protein
MSLKVLAADPIGLNSQVRDVYEFRELVRDLEGYCRAG